MIWVIYFTTDKSFTGLYKAFSEREGVGRYIYTERAGFIDMQHFFAAANTAYMVGKYLTLELGSYYEIFQYFKVSESAFDKEDPMSNYVGANFGEDFSDLYGVEGIHEFVNYMMSLLPLDPNDPKIARDKIFIPENENDIELPDVEEFNYHSPKPFHGMDVNYPKYYRELRDPYLYQNIK